MAAALGIDEDLQTMLTFYHDLGRIIYFGSLSKDKSALNDIVVLDPQWLVEIFKRVIRLSKPKEMVNCDIIQCRVLLPVLWTIQLAYNLVSIICTPKSPDCYLSMIYIF